MRDILGMEFRRGYESKGLKIALVIGVVLAFLNIYESNIQNEMMKGIMPYPEIITGYYMGTNYQFVHRTLFYTLLPILAALPMGASYYKDLKTGYLKNVCIKTSKKQYYKAKYIVTFFWGCIVIMIPLVISLMLTTAYYPVMKPEPFAMQNMLISKSFLVDVYYENPLIYVIIYIVIDSLIGGIFAVISLCISRYAKNAFFVLVFPMVIYLISDMIFADMFDISELSPLQMVDAVQFQGTSGVCLSMFIVLGIIMTSYLFCNRESRKDVL